MKKDNQRQWSRFAHSRRLNRGRRNARRPFPPSKGPNSAPPSKSNLCAITELTETTGRADRSLATSGVKTRPARSYIILLAILIRPIGTRSLLRIRSLGGLGSLGRRGSFGRLGPDI